MNHIVIGDTLQILKELSPESVNCIITSPPYWGLRDYGPETNTFFGGDLNCEHKWNEEKMTLLHENRNFCKGTQEEVHKERPTTFIKKYDYMKSGFCSKCGAWYGQLGLEPTIELYIEHLLAITKELHRVLRKDGVMFWNHGDCYGGSGCGKNDYRNNNKRSISVPALYADKPNPQAQLTPKCMALQHYRLVLRMIDEQGWILRNIIIWSKPNHMPSSVRDRFTNAYEPVFMLVKNKKYWFDLDAVRKPHKPLNRWGGNIMKKTEIMSDAYAVQPRNRLCQPNPLGKNPGNIWTIPTRPFPEAHFAVFPEKLIEPMIKCGCPKEICSKCGKPRDRIVNRDLIDTEGWGPARKDHHKSIQGSQSMIRDGKGRAGTSIVKTIGWTKCDCQAKFIPGVVLDPFLGSGTTMVVAERLGVNCIGIELNPKYVQIARKRMKLALSQSDSKTSLRIIDNRGV